MRSDYKKLGDYIRPVDERNTDLAITNILGISVSKKFIPTIANIIGTDLSTYKIVRNGQFAYAPDTSRRGDKICVALLECKDCIVSSSYFPFEVYKTNKLLPEYLKLWFLRPEFDRYARFMSNGSAREIFDWECMCNVELPVPSLLEQHKIVRIYNEIIDRIELLQKINRNLEEQTQALFKSWFVSFKHWGGVRPSEWTDLTLGEVSDIRAGGDKPKYISTHKCSSCNIPVFSNGIDQDGLYGYTNVARIKEESVTVSARGTIGFVCLRHQPYVPIVRLITMIPNALVSAKYLYLWLKNCLIQGTGSTQQQLTVPDFKKNMIMVPDFLTMESFTKTVTPFFELIWSYQEENKRLIALRDTLLPCLMSGKLDVSSLGN